MQRLTKYGSNMSKRVWAKYEDRYAKLSTLVERCHNTPAEQFDGTVAEEIEKVYERLLDESAGAVEPV